MGTTRQIDLRIVHLPDVMSDKVDMGRIIRQSAPLVAAVLASSLFLHWSVSSLQNVNWRDLYHDSFLVIFFAFWKSLGVEGNRIGMVGQPTADGIRFIAPLIGVLIFLAIARIATLKCIGMSVLVAMLCSLASPLIGLITLPFLIEGNPFGREFVIVLACLAVCLYTTVPRRFWCQQFVG